MRSEVSRGKVGVATRAAVVLVVAPAARNARRERFAEAWSATATRDTL